ncbi:aliphatic sulfonate ABC transporter substrate-binding protein [Paenibacillus roseipurpureus]|uniref:Putative aliphatic sulfonates-binding protein n=1 Tax=Paenibacillus roseopurpureus TaxID=2918901 RepID=A0AA96LQC8_9BACL|nr:aliphatic sulfonate ABC transporter substrate-binding protein [Paenibacillus sp. MBLB1832]WNR44079.1 aliphatic sulfonate ABC transporter substrate-binding protein [Paenibacillus sp. MBLB1832]
MSKFLSHKPMLLVTAAFLSLTVLAGCASNKSDTKNASAPAKDPIKVNVAINGGISPLTVLKEKGWLQEAFKAENAEIVWSEFPSGPPLLEALVAGRVDVSFLGDGATLSGLSSGLPFQIIGLTSEGARSNALIVPANSPIKSVEDLKGKKVALAKGTTAHVYLLKLLSAHGLQPNSVEIVNLQPDDAAAAFTSGQLDAWVAWDPNITIQLGSGKAKSIAWDKEGILSPVSLIAQNDFLTKHPNLVTTYLKQYKKAAAWMKDNQDDAAKLFSEQKKVPVDTMKTLLTNSSVDLQAYTDKTIKAQQETADLLLSNGFIKKTVDVKAFINNKLVQDALK